MAKQMQCKPKTQLKRLRQSNNLMKNQPAGDFFEEVHTRVQVQAGQYQTNGSAL